jgi:hypothetical protein
MSEFMQTPCKKCPFRNDVKPYLSAERGEELAYAALNKYNNFQCHLTTVEDEDSDEGEMYATEDSKECAGFLTIRAANGIATPKGFKPAWELCYTDAFDMIQAYEENI